MNLNSWHATIGVSYLISFSNAVLNHFFVSFFSLVFDQKIKRSRDQEIKRSRDQEIKRSRDQEGKRERGKGKEGKRERGKEEKGKKEKRTIGSRRITRWSSET